MLFLHTIKQQILIYMSQKEQDQLNDIWFEVRKSPLPDEQPMMQKLNDTISKQIKVNDSLYIYSNSYQALCCYYIFAFGKGKQIKYSDKMFKILQNAKSEREDIEKICFKEFNINLQKETPLIQKMGNIQNRLSYHKILLQKASQGIDKNDANGMVRSLANKIPISTHGDGLKLNCRESKNFILIGQSKKKPFLFIFSQSIPQNQKMEELSPKSKSSKMSEYSLNRISNSSSENSEKESNKKRVKVMQSKPKKKDEEKKQANIKEGSDQAFESNQFTWFQGIILIIVILALLSHFFGIFDEQIRDYNLKKRQYYLIQSGYTIAHYISKVYQSIFS